MRELITLCKEHSERDGTKCTAAVFDMAGKATLELDMVVPHVGGSSCTTYLLPMSPDEAHELGLALIRASAHAQAGPSMRDHLGIGRRAAARALRELAEELDR